MKHILITVGLQLFPGSVLAQTTFATITGLISDPNGAVLPGASIVVTLLRAPWETITLAAAIWSPIGLGGLIYTVIVLRRMRKQATYQPEFGDWLFHVVLPLVAYAVLAGSALASPAHTRLALFGVGPAALLLLFIGIHNAWDAVAYHVFVSRQDTGTERGRSRPSENETR